MSRLHSGIHRRLAVVAQGRFMYATGTMSRSDELRALAEKIRSGGAPKYLANLAGLARQRLAALGITAIYGNDGGDAWCTVLNGSRFFSHRRDAARLGSSGRFAACIWKD